MPYNAFKILQVFKFHPQRVGRKSQNRPTVVFTAPQMTPIYHSYPLIMMHMSRSEDHGGTGLSNSQVLSGFRTHQMSWALLVVPVPVPTVPVVPRKKVLCWQMSTASWKSLRVMPCKDPWGSSCWSMRHLPSHGIFRSQLIQK